MRQRLLSEPDRYRGRRRVPTPPRSRYAIVVTTAFVGAGVVALGAAAALPDAKTVSPSALAELESGFATDADAAARAESADRASRDDVRAGTPMMEAPDVWVLPLKDYEFIAPYGVQRGKMHAGIDLAAAEGTPYLAIHSGTVKLARWYGGFGYTVIVEHDDGTESLYGHSAKLMVKEGQQVKAGEVLGLVGNTGHSYGSRLHLELNVNGDSTDPVPWLRDKGADIKLKIDSIYAEAVAS